MTATAGNAQATVSFTAPTSDGGSAITGYTVISSPAGGVDSNAGTTALTHTITGLANGTAYTFTVTATNAMGTGAASAASNSVTPKGSQTITFGTAPAVVVGGTGAVSATGGASGNVVTFTSTTTGVCTVSGATVTGVTAGTCTIAADQAGNANYNAATQVTQSFTVTAATTYTVTPSAGANGAISPSAPQTVSSGSTTTFTVTPNTGYTASVGGTCGGSLSGTTYTISAITANCTVEAAFTLIDATAPTTTATPAGGTFGTTQSVALACADNAGGSGCAATRYTTDGTTPTASSPVYSAPIAISTTTTLKFFSTDAAGNSEAAKTETYTIDTVAPAITINAVTSPTNVSSQIIGGTVEAGGTVAVSLNGGTAANAVVSGTTWSYAVTGLKEGANTITAKATDAAGNAATATASITVDTAAPVTTASPAGGTFGAAQSVLLSCADNTGGTGCSKTYYTTDGSAPTTTSPVYSAPIAASTTTTLKFFSTDVAGNSEAAKTATYTIDKTPPVLSVPPAVNFAAGLGQTTVLVPIGTATATDDSGGSVAVTNDALNYNKGNAQFALGVATVAWTAKDPSGNTATGTQKVTVFIPPGGGELVFFKTTADGKRIIQKVKLATNSSGVVNLTAAQKSFQLQLTAAYPDGSSEADITSQFTFASTDSSVAAVDSGGLISAVSDGTATVKATYEGQTAPVQVAVNLADTVTATIPAISPWGLALLGILLLIAGVNYHKGTKGTERGTKAQRQKAQSLFRFHFLLLPLCLLPLCLCASLLPVMASTEKIIAITKAGYVRLLTQSQAKSPFTPPNAGSLSEEALFKAVRDLMKPKGVSVLEGAKEKDPLTREEQINLTYAFITGEKGNSTIENKFFLKEKGIISKDDIGFIRSFEGDVTTFRQGSDKGTKITGWGEPVLFKDIDETDEGARIELEFDDLSVLTIGEDARIEINKMVYDPVKNTREVLIQQHVGKMRVKVSKVDSIQTNFTVKTPTAVIGVRGTEFVSYVARDGKTDVVAIEGWVGVKPLTPQKDKEQKEKKEEKKGKSEGKEGEKESEGETKEGGKEGEQTGDVKEGETKEGEATGEAKGEAKGGGESGSAETAPAKGGTESSVGTGGDSTGMAGSGGLTDTGGGEEIIVAANTSVSVSKGEGMGQIAAVSTESMKAVVQETTVQKPIEVKGGGMVATTEAVKTSSTVAQVAKATEGEKKEETAKKEEKGKGEEAPVGTKEGEAKTETSTDSTGAGSEGATETKKTEPTDSKNLIDQTAKESGTKTKETAIDKTEKENKSDTDGDGVVDANDAFPNDPKETLDTDKDGIGDNADPFPYVAQTKSGMSAKIVASSGGNTVVVDPDLAAAMMKENLDKITGTGATLDPVNSAMATESEIKNGDFLPSKYKHGLQVGKDYMNPSALQAIESSGSLAYAVQVEEDYLNWVALQVYKDFAGSLAAYYNSMDPVNPSTGAKDRAKEAYFLRDTINTKLENGNIRERDAYLAQESDAKAGRVLKDAHGNWVRVQQYVLTPDDYSVEALNINLRGSGAGNLSGLAYMDWKTVFSDSIGGVNLTTLPWGHWLNTQGTQLGGVDPLRVANPSSYGLVGMWVSVAGSSGAIGESRTFNGLSGGYQNISQQMLKVSNNATGASTEFKFDPSPANPSLVQSYYTSLSGSGNPQGFKYSINDKGISREINTNFYVLGNSTTTASEGVMSTGFGTVSFKDIWMALGTGTSSTMPSIGSHAKGFGDNGLIGNNLEIRFQDGA
ncbi:MAG: chitobiase/beta-hexosaminidase C-terminal domain-containing protein, partial [Desulfovibrio sp.]|nr:chitobiase/beta-hexosaminidase C-terminal domain-containing protein [Desulfovibrio sp.]